MKNKIETRIFYKSTQHISINFNPKNEPSYVGMQKLKEICSTRNIKCRTVEIYDEGILKNPHQYYLSINICRMNSDVINWCKKLTLYKEIEKFLLSIN